MFSGLIQHLCPVGSVKGDKLSVQAPSQGYKIGESISINGVCLSATKIQPKGSRKELWFELSAETLKKTNLKTLKPGTLVNFERSLTLKDLLGGHLVQGHIDGMGSVKKILSRGSKKDIWFSAPKEILRYVVSKGSIAVNGVSLTAVKATPKSFSVALIPVTLKETNLGRLKVGEKVNLEADIMAKYVERFVKNKK